MLVHICSKAVDEHADENTLVDNTSPDTAAVYHNIEDNMPYRIHLLKEVVKKS